MTLNISASLTACGAKQDDKASDEVRPVMALTEAITVMPSFDADPEQVYDVPYDQLRRMFGKETQITVNLNPNGTLSGINGTVNDQVGPGAVAAIDAAVKIAAGVLVPAIGISEGASAASQAVTGGMQEDSYQPTHRKRKRQAKPVDHFCTPNVLTALDQIEELNQDAAKKAATDANDKTSVPSPDIAKDQADIARLQAENRLTKTLRLTWTPSGNETPALETRGIAFFARSVDLYGILISDWLSPSGKAWYAAASAGQTYKGKAIGEPERTAALAVTQPIVLQLELKRFTTGRPLAPGTAADKVDETHPTQLQPAGIVLRDPAQGMMRLCRGSCSAAGDTPQDTSGEMQAPVAVAMGQFGRTLVFHIKNRLFENSNFSISLASDGSISSLGNHTTGTLATGLQTLGTAGSDAVSNFAAYDTAVAAKYTNTVNRRSLADTLNKNLADCLDQQAAVRKSGGVPIGTCN